MNWDCIMNTIIVLLLIFGGVMPVIRCELNNWMDLISKMKNKPKNEIEKEEG